MDYTDGIGDRRNVTQDIPVNNLISSGNSTTSGTLGTLTRGNFSTSSKTTTSKWWYVLIIILIILAVSLKSFNCGLKSILPILTVPRNIRKSRFN